MKAIVVTKYGPADVLQLKEVEKPVPNESQILVKVHAASANPVDRARMGMPFLLRLITGVGLFKPKITSLGTDLAGRVETVGKNVTEFRPGDEVFGVSSGVFSEYVCTTEKALALKPANLSFEAAAAVPVAALTALQGLRDKGQIKAGQRVLICGASGGVGTFAVQLAKSFGAEVTAVCSTHNVATARLIGADHVIDYTREDFTKNGQRYDLILAVNGYHSIAGYRRALSPKGICVVVGGMAQVIQAMLLGPLVSRIGRKKIGFMGITRTRKKDLVALKELLEAGKVAAVIDKTYPLSETAEAFRYLEKGHARGKIVITVEQNNKT